MRLSLSITTDCTDFDRRFEVADEKDALELLADTLADVEKRFLKKPVRGKETSPARSAASIVPPSSTPAAK